MYAHGVTWGTKDGGESSRNIYVYVPRTAGPWPVSSLTGHRLELGMAGHPRNWTLRYRNVCAPLTLDHNPAASSTSSSSSGP